MDLRELLELAFGRVGVPPRSPSGRRVAPLHWPRATRGGIPLGVDVEERAVDICKLVRAVVAQRGLPLGQTVEDLAQDTVVALLTRNRTRSAFDPRKSKFGHYVWMVATNVLLNAVEKGRAKSRIPYAALVPIEDESGAGGAHRPGFTLSHLQAPAPEEADDGLGELAAGELLERARVAIAAARGAEPTMGMMARAVGATVPTLKAASSGGTLPEEPLARLRALIRAGRILSRATRPGLHKAVPRPAYPGGMGARAVPPADAARAA